MQKEEWMVRDMERGMKGKNRTVHKGRKFLQISLLCLGLGGLSLGVQAADMGVYLTEAEGDVSVENAGGRSLSWSEGERLKSGNRIFANGNGRGRINIGDSGELLLEAGGILEYRSREDEQEFLLENGILFFDLDEESEDFSIRTSTTAFASMSDGVKGWIRIVDRYHTLLCLEEGSLSCCVTDPVSGQVKSASLTEETVAECVVYPKEENGERCDILLRTLNAEDQQEAVQTAKAVGTAYEMQKLLDNSSTNNSEKPDLQSEQKQLALLRDPVWGEMELADAVLREENEELEASEDGEELIDGGKPVRYFPGIVMPPSIPYTPLSGGIFTEEMQVAVSEPDYSSGSGSKPSSSKPSSPEPPSSESTSASLTQDQGLVGRELRNYGTIRVEEGGKLSLKDEEGEILTLRNLNQEEDGKGVIVNKGVIEGRVENYQAASFTMESGSVTKVENMWNTKGRIQISGGIVEEGVDVSDGFFEMTGGTIKAPEGEDTAAVDIQNRNYLNTVTEAKITGGTILNENGGSAIRLRGGELELSDRAVVKAKEPLKLLTFDTGHSSLSSKINLNYVSAGKTYTRTVPVRGELAALYVTKQGTDGLVTLNGLGESFSDAVGVINAGKGDRITLSGDVSDTESNTVIEAKGGTTSAPVVLDLHEKSLTIGSSGPSLGFHNALWNVEKGQLFFMNGGAKITGNPRISIDAQSNVTLSDVTVNGTDIENRGKCTLSKVTMNQAVLENMGTCTMSDTTVEFEIVNNGTCVAENVTTGDLISTEGVFKGQTITVKNSIKNNFDYKGEGLNKVSRLSITDLTYEGVEFTNDTNGICELSKAKMEIDDKISNVGSLTISGSEIIGNYIENNGEFAVSKSEITVFNIENGYDPVCTSPVCRLTDCTAVFGGGEGPDYGIRNSGGDLYIMGGNLSANGMNSLILSQPSEREQKIEIGGGAKLSKDGLTDAVINIESFPVSEMETKCGIRSITIGYAVIDGGAVPVIKGSLQDDLNKTILTVKEGAQLSSECAEGTISINNINHTDVPKRLEVHLNGGSIVNKSRESGERTWNSNYAALNFGSFSFERYFPDGVLLEGTETEVWVNGDREPLVYFESYMSPWKLCSKALGYGVQQREDGNYLVAGAGTAALSILPEQTESEPLEEQLPAEQIDGETPKPEDLSKEEEEQEDDQEKEEDQKEEAEQGEGEKQEEEDDKDALLPSEKEDMIEEGDDASVEPEEA